MDSIKAFALAAAVIDLFPNPTEARVFIDGLHKAGFQIVPIEAVPIPHDANEAPKPAEFRRHRVGDKVRAIKWLRVGGVGVISKDDGDPQEGAPFSVRFNDGEELRGYSQSELELVEAAP